MQENQWKIFLRKPATAYFFDKIEKNDEIIDMNYYSDSSGEKDSAIKFMVETPTFCYYIPYGTV